MPFGNLLEQVDERLAEFGAVAVLVGLHPGAVVEVRQESQWRLSERRDRAGFGALASCVAPQRGQNRVGLLRSDAVARPPLGQGLAEPLVLPATVGVERRTARGGGEPARGGVDAHPEPVRVAQVQQHARQRRPGAGQEGAVAEDPPERVQRRVDVRRPQLGHDVVEAVEVLGDLVHRRASERGGKPVLAHPAGHLLGVEHLPETHGLVSVQVAGTAVQQCYGFLLTKHAAGSASRTHDHVYALSLRRVDQLDRCERGSPHTSMVSMVARTGSPGKIPDRTPATTRVSCSATSSKFGSVRTQWRIRRPCARWDAINMLTCCRVTPACFGRP